MQVHVEKYELFVVLVSQGVVYWLIKGKWNPQLLRWIQDHICFQEQLMVLDLQNKNRATQQRPYLETDLWMTIPMTGMFDNIGFFISPTYACFSFVKIIQFKYHWWHKTGQSVNITICNTILYGSRITERVKCRSYEALSFILLATSI